MNNLTGPRNGKLASDYIGSCVRCRYGIYQGHTHHRGRGLWLGLLCSDCHRQLNGEAR